MPNKVRRPMMRAHPPEHPQHFISPQQPSINARQVFVGLDLESAARPMLADLSRDLGPKVAWVNASQLHMVLRQVGMVGPRVLRVTARVMHGIRQKPLSILLTGTGITRHKDGSASLWIAADKRGLLEDLYNDVSRSLVRMGIPPSGHSLHPHIVLAHVEAGADMAPVQKWLNEYAEFKARLHGVDSFSLFTVEHDNRNKESYVQPLETYPLKAPQRAQTEMTAQGHSETDEKTEAAAPKQDEAPSSPES